MAVVCPESIPTLRAVGPTRLMVIGGAPLGQRKIWWNFVHSNPDRIEQAKADWEAGRFDAVPGDKEFIPLPSS
jgi:redox-sensitive bicupin YhaK (pirin superfamily)